MNPFFPGNGEGSVIMTAMLVNPQRKPLTIMSGEFKDLNGKVLAPGREMEIRIEIPEGFREFMYQQNIMGRDVLYVGLRAADAAEPFVHKADI